MLQFPHIAGLAEGLSVCALIQPTAHNWDNVVKHKFVSCITPKAFAVSPVFTLPPSKAVSVPLLITWLLWMVELSQHFVAVVLPSVPKGLAHLCLSFRGMLVAFGRPRLGFVWSGPFTGGNECFNFLSVVSAPKGVIGPLHGNTDALTIATGFSYPTGYLRSAPIKDFTAHGTSELLACASPRTDSWQYFFWHWLPCDNRVNSVKHPTVPLTGSVVNTEPSRACKDVIVPRGTEGVTTRSCGNNNGPTSARPEREDIVWAAW